MGGTRFIGKPIVEKLRRQGHQITIFTRGNNPVPADVEHLKGDRNTKEGLESLNGRAFDLIIDSSAREKRQVQHVLQMTGVPKHRLLFVSSAGVYCQSSILPIDEKAEIDPLSRHFGKAETENWLLEEGIPFTSFRPTYIYGPGNYNPIERWFFDRICNNRPVPMPGDGSTITQLGHVLDLSQAICRSVDSDIATNRIYNCSGKKAVTFLGLIEAAAKACGIDPQSINKYSFNPSTIDPKARKIFPLRLTNFYTDTSRLESDLGWKSNFSLEEGLLDSYNNDYKLNPSNNPDFSSDDLLIQA